MGKIRRAIGASIEHRGLVRRGIDGRHVLGPTVGHPRVGARVRATVHGGVVTSPALSTSLDEVSSGRATSSGGAAVSGTAASPRQRSPVESNGTSTGLVVSPGVTFTPLTLPVASTQPPLPRTETWTATVPEVPSGR